jgi:hypothetical protein
VTYLLLFGPPVLLVAIALLLSKTKTVPSPTRRLATTALGLVPVALLAMSHPGTDSNRPLGTFLYLALPVAAILYFSQSEAARESPLLVVIAVPLLWVVGLLAGCVVTVNMGLISP